MGNALSKSERTNHESPAQCHGPGGGGRAGTSPEAKEPVAARPGRLIEAAPFRGRDDRESPAPGERPRIHRHRRGAPRRSRGPSPPGASEAGGPVTGYAEFSAKLPGRGLREAAIIAPDVTT